MSSSAVLALRHSTMARLSPVGQFISRASLLACFNIVPGAGFAHGQKAVPEWDMALWNNPESFILTLKSYSPNGHTRVSL